jgi:hypothetical protein
MAPSVTVVTPVKAIELPVIDVVTAATSIGVTLLTPTYACTIALALDAAAVVTTVAAGIDAGSVTTK